MNNRMGRIPDFHLFDGDYFGIMGQMVEMLDPQVRLITESTHEAIIDAGIQSIDFRKYITFFLLFKDLTRHHFEGPELVSISVFPITR